MNRTCPISSRTPASALVDISLQPTKQFLRFITAPRGSIHQASHLCQCLCQRLRERWRGRTQFRVLRDKPAAELLRERQKTAVIGGEPIANSEFQSSLMCHG